MAGEGARVFTALSGGEDGIEEPGAELSDYEPAAPAGSPLEALRAEAGKDAERDPITLDCPGRPGWQVRFAATVDLDKLGRWSKVCKDRKQPDGIDSAKLMRITLANQCEAVIWQGQDVVGADGKTVTFRSADFLELTGKPKHTDAIFHWYGKSDGVITVINGKLLVASGFDEDAVREGVFEDPTLP